MEQKLFNPLRWNKLFLMLVITCSTIGIMSLTAVVGVVTSIQTIQRITNLSNKKSRIAFTTDIPQYDEIKGSSDGVITDEMAQTAVGVAVKYRLLPSVILSQWAFESAWGKSSVATTDSNYFGITWFNNSPFPQGSERAEGGNYMHFSDFKECFNYYGYMIASQSNFNESVGKTSPGEVLLILGRGGYAEAGISEGSSYYTAAMKIINDYDLVEKYDKFAINHWGDYQLENASIVSENGSIDVLESVLEKEIYNGECYGLTAYYVDQLGGPSLMGSGHSYASQIGADYDWKSHGWQVIFDPSPSDLQPGDIINWDNGTSVYGHTGIIYNVSEDGQSFSTYEQNASQGRICAKYNRTYSMWKVTSVVRKTE